MMKWHSFHILSNWVFLAAAMIFPAVIAAAEPAPAAAAMPPPRKAKRITVGLLGPRMLYEVNLHGQEAVDRMIRHWASELKWVLVDKPDLIVLSALMPHLDGIDLAIGLAAMPSTRNTPIAVITSLDPDDERLALLPKKIPVVHKGATFGDDLFKALDSLFLI